MFIHIFYQSYQSVCELKKLGQDEDYDQRRCVEEHRG